MGRLHKTVLVTLAALTAAGFSGSAVAQSDICMRLQARLTALDSRDLGNNPNYQRDAALQRRRAELDRATEDARRAGCIGSSFFRRLAGNANCRAVMANINRIRADLNRLTAARNGTSNDPFSGRRERIELVNALRANGCGDQYDAFDRPARRQGLLASLFGGGLFRERGWGGTYSNYGTYRTLCVRTCDGYYFPISFSTTRSSFAADELACQARCPGTDVALYIHRNPGQEADQMISLAGEPYVALPTAFRYRREYDSSCSCGKVTATPPALSPVAGQMSSQGGDLWLDNDYRQDPWRFARGAKGPGLPGGLPPVPRSRPAPGEDPETLANRKGGIAPPPRESAPAPAAVAGVDPEGNKTVRIVGPSYFYAQ